MHSKDLSNKLLLMFSQTFRATLGTAGDLPISDAALDSIVPKPRQIGFVSLLTRMCRYAAELDFMKLMVAKLTHLVDNVT